MSGAKDDPPADYLDWDDVDIQKLPRETVESFLEDWQNLLVPEAGTSGGNATGQGVHQLKADLAEVMKKLEVAETDQVTLRRVAEDVQPVCDELEESMPRLAADIRSERAVGEEVRAAHGWESLEEGEAAAAMRARERTRQERALDLAFVVDNTGSMEWCIDATKNKLADIMATVVEKHPNVRLRLAYVGYRDHCDEKQFEMMPFTDQEPVKTLRTFLAPVEAYGGGDGPEDVVGGIDAVATKVCLLFADYPCHGRTYTDLPDDFPDGDPQGETCEQYLRQLASKGVDLHFARITNRTDQMVRVWKRDVFDGNDGCFFEEHDCKAEAADFVPVVLRSLQRSLSKSSTGSSETSTPLAPKSTQAAHRMARTARHARR